MSEEKSNAEKAIAETEVVIAGGKHVLRYTLWSFCKLDEMTGKNPLESASWGDVRPKDILALLWAGLLHEGNPMTMEELGNKISLTEINKLGPVIQRAVGQAVPSAEEEKKTLSSENEAN